MTPGVDDLALLAESSSLTLDEAKRLLDKLDEASKQDNPLLWLAEATAPLPEEPGGEA